MTCSLCSSASEEEAAYTHPCTLSSTEKLSEGEESRRTSPLLVFTATIAAVLLHNVLTSTTEPPVVTLPLSTTQQGQIRALPAGMPLRNKTNNSHKKKIPYKRLSTQDDVCGGGVESWIWTGGVGWDIRMTCVQYKTTHMKKHTKKRIRRKHLCR
jgi:hypothetical protein